MAGPSTGTHPWRTRSPRCRAFSPNKLPNKSERKSWNCSLMMTLSISRAMAAQALERFCFPPQRKPLASPCLMPTSDSTSETGSFSPCALPTAPANTARQTVHSAMPPSTEEADTHANANARAWLARATMTSGTGLPPRGPLAPAKGRISNSTCHNGTLPTPEASLSKPV